MEGIGGWDFEDCNEAQALPEIVGGVYGVCDYVLDHAAADRLRDVSLDLLAAR